MHNLKYRRSFISEDLCQNQLKKITVINRPMGSTLWPKYLIILIYSKQVNRPTVIYIYMCV